MKTILVRNLCQIMLLALLLPATGRMAYSATIVWTNTLGGNWSLAANWNPNQVPGAGDTAEITNAGTYAVTLDVNASVFSLAIGGANSGVQTLQGSSFSLAATNATVNGGGVLGLNSSSFNGALAIASGGICNAGGGENINAQVTVENGGEFLAGGSTTLGGNANSSNEWVSVQSGGFLNTASGVPIFLYVQLTNAGTLNFTNYGIPGMYNPGNSPNYDGGLVNQAGGIINLIGSASIAGNGGSDFVLNQGTINATNGTSTINVDNMFNQGTVTDLPGAGMLTIGTFNGLGTLAGTYNAAAGTIIQFVANNGPGTSAGAALTLVGSGQFQFAGGWLTLPTNVIPNLALDGGTLLLGPGFQGGAITNLALNNMTLTNTLPITGTLVMSGGTLYTTNTLNSGTSISLNQTTLNGAIIVANNGLLLTSGGANLDAQVTVESGGELLANGSTTLGGNNSNSNNWVVVQSGGSMTAAASAPITVYDQLTNAGTLNFTNAGISGIYNPGNSQNYDGGLVNQAGGVINLIGSAGIAGNGGSDFLLNQGSINVTNSSSCTINVDNMLNQGTVATLPSASTLIIGNFNGLGALTGTYNAAPGTIIQFVSNYNPGTSVGAGLTLGGSGQYQFTGGLLTLTTNVIPKLALDGGTLSLGPGFQGGSITNLTLNNMILTNTLPITGTLAMSGGTLYTTNTLNNGAVLSLFQTTLNGAIIVANNGLLLTSGGATLDAQVTVENGGEFLANGSTTLGGNASNSNNWVVVQSGGFLNTASGAPITIYVQLTNAGTLNFTNYGVSGMYNPGNSPNYDGALINQAGGILNLIGNAGISGNGGFDFLLNQGTINVTNSSTCTVNVDNMINQGTVATLPSASMLTIGSFNGLGALTGTYNAAAGTIIQFFSNNGPGTSVGAGLTLGGSGQYQFTGGWLTLPTNVIPDLALDGGTLFLGPGFQGGAITNLTLNNMTLTNTLPITGTLAMTNGSLYATNTLGNGALLSLNQTTLNGSIIVTNNGVLMTGNSTTLNAQVTVESGGVFLVNGSTTLGGNASNSNNWVVVQSGGFINTASGAPLTIYVQLTNAGTFSLTNYGISGMYNPGNSPNYDGALINQAGGTINLIGAATISGSGGFDFVLNEGTINVTNGNSTINVDNFTNFATLNAELWTLQLQGSHLSLQPSGSLAVALAGPTTIGNFNIAGNAALTGAFAATLSDGYIPMDGSVFTPLSYGSFSGALTSFNLARLPGAAWQPVYSTNALTLVIQPLIAFLPSGTNLAVSVNAIPGHQAIELTGTNVTEPLANWTPLSTNTVDVTTYLSVTNDFNPNEPRRFFTFQLK